MYSHQLPRPEKKDKEQVNVFVQTNS
jgi:hypothetical protein